MGTVDLTVDTPGHQTSGDPGRGYVYGPSSSLVYDPAMFVSAGVIVSLKVVLGALTD